MDYLRKNMINPEELTMTEHKRVLASFLIDAEGACRDIKIVESGGSAFDQEVIRVLRKMPKWKPAISKGSPTETRVTQLITFSLPGNDTP
jgi:protein TonB